MPTYCQKCRNPACRFEFDDTRSVKMSGLNPKCQKCGARSERDFVREHSQTAHHPGNWPMKCMATGVSPRQVGKAYAQSVKLGVPTQFDAKTGEAILTSPEHRMKFCQALGYHDNNAGYSDPLPGVRRAC